VKPQIKINRPVLQEEGFFSHVCREACENELTLEEFGCYDGFVQKLGSFFDDKR